MLKQTFSHIPGISKSTELYLWKNNILSWNDFFLKEKKLNLMKRTYLLLLIIASFTFNIVYSQEGNNTKGKVLESL